MPITNCAWNVSKPRSRGSTLKIDHAASHPRMFQKAAMPQPNHCKCTMGMIFQENLATNNAPKTIYLISFSYQLDSCEVSLPPQVLLHVRSQTSKSVVGVHKYMNKCIHRGSQDRWKKWRAVSLHRAGGEGHAAHAMASWKDMAKKRHNLHNPPATHLMPVHQIGNMVAWWYTWRKEIWLFFFRNTKKIVSRNSISFEM